MTLKAYAWRAARTSFSTDYAAAMKLKSEVKEGIHLYLAYKALCDGYRVCVALLEMMKKIPETNPKFTAVIKMRVPDFYVLPKHTSNSPVIHCTKQLK